MSLPDRDVMTKAPEELLTVRDWLRWAVSRFREAGLFFGHGSDDAYDEAAYLVLHALHLPPDRLEPFLDARVTREERLAVHDLLLQRIVRRLPAAYLTHEAFLGPYRFYVDERVIVPRSYFGELLSSSLVPWIADPEAIADALDMCTGSGCLAIMMADAFPNATLDAVDLSPAALEVARRNVSDYGLDDRIRLVESDLFDALAGRTYDVIVCNPPYVTGQAMAALPEEFHHEPAMALGSGVDGLDVVRRLLAQARRHLKPGGILAVEVGHNRPIVEQAFPRIPFVWADTEHSAGKVFLLQREQLPAGRHRA